VSDDEDDTHPNVDTPSLFRMRHRARVQREEELRKTRFEMDREGDRIRREKEKQKKKLDKNSNQANREQYEATLKKEREWQAKENELAAREKAQAWNVDTLSKDVASKTLINKPRAKYTHYDDMTEEEKNKSFETLHKDEELKKKIKQWGMMSKPVDSRAFLAANPDLCSDQTASFLTIWCIDLQQEGKTALVDVVAKQCISMQFILELAKHTKRHPADCFAPFYAKRIAAETETVQSKDSKTHQEAFDDEFKAFLQRVQIRAKQRDEEKAAKEKEEAENKKLVPAEGSDLGADEEYVELSKEERLEMSPGGLDPAEVFENLPEELQECFASRNTETLQKLIQEDFPKYAEHMRKCVLSGLWVPTEDSPLYQFLLPENKDVKLILGNEDGNGEERVIAGPGVDPEEVANDAEKSTSDPAAKEETTETKPTADQNTAEAPKARQVSSLDDID